jgi:hypothetical protein
MTIILSAEQTQAWNEGGWISLEIQETILEDIEHQGIREPVAVVGADGVTLFWVTAGKGVI